jgi:hypothetical protein
MTLRAATAVAVLALAVVPSLAGATGFEAPPPEFAAIVADSGALPSASGEALVVASLLADYAGSTMTSTSSNGWTSYAPVSSSYFPIRARG